MSKRCKKIMERALKVKRRLFEGHLDFEQVEREAITPIPPSPIMMMNPDNQITNINHDCFQTTNKPLSPSIILIDQLNDSYNTDHSESEKTYETLQNINSDEQFNFERQDNGMVNNLENEIQTESEMQFGCGTDGIEVACSVLEEQQQASGVGSSQGNKSRPKRKVKKSYIDFVSDDDGDFHWSSSSWSGESNEEDNQDISTRKKYKRRSTQEGKVGDAGLKKKAKTNKRKDNKQLRNEGKEYRDTTGSIVQPKQMKAHPCLDKKCGRTCYEVNDERRQSLFDYFQTLSLERKRDWLVSNSQAEEIKRKRTKEIRSRRLQTFVYFINEGEGRRQVCQKFLTQTLDITQRFIYYTLSNAQYSLAKTDMRGKHVPPNKTSAEIKQTVVDYIKNLPAVPSHYCRKDSTRMYLPQEYKNLSNLYQLYKKDYTDKAKDFVGEKVFRNIFLNEFNLAFHVPKKDKCLKCVSFKNNPEGFTSEEIKGHEKEAEDSKARFLYHQDIGKHEKYTLCASFDLQKVLNTPYGESMLFYYSRKYSVYNLTIYESQTQEVYCYTWGEADGKRGGNEIATILTKYIKMVDERQTVKNLLLYSDSCGGQNRNKIVFAAVHTAVQACKYIKTIQMNFLLPGHTSMPVDSVHSVIERSVENMIVFAPSQWATVFELARKNPKPYNVEVLTYSDFQAWDSIADKYFKNNLAGKISKVRIATFKENISSIIIKNSMSDSAFAEKVEVISKNKRLEDNLYNNRLPIPKQKHGDLMKLCKTFAIPRRYHEEYFSLQPCNAKETLPDTDIEDNVDD